MSYIRQNVSGLVYCALQLWINVVGLGQQTFNLFQTGDVGSMSLSFFLPCSIAILTLRIRTTREKPDLLTFLPSLPALLLYPILVRLIFYYN
ncbi:MAG: hypothetical protein AAB337_00930 [Patescibacteria group bacterium]